MAFGTCTWQFKDGSWTIVASNCDPGHVCAAGLTAAQSAPRGFTVPDSQFRKQLNNARMLATGSPLDVIPAKLTPANGTTFDMDCV
jgi:hypothetical protein